MAEDVEALARIAQMIAISVAVPIWVSLDSRPVLTPNAFRVERATAALKLTSMEEAEVPLENLQEHVHHSAEHSGEAWVSWVALSTAILAVLATIASLLSGQH
ncbi:MAG: hypothetical protein DME66_00240, partial [Verrucomicrobia bacterium]